MNGRDAMSLHLKLGKQKKLVSDHLVDGMRVISTIEIIIISGNRGGDGNTKNYTIWTLQIEKKRACEYHAHSKNRTQKTNFD